MGGTSRPGHWCRQSRAEFSGYPSGSCSRSRVTHSARPQVRPEPRRGRPQWQAGSRRASQAACVSSSAVPPVPGTETTGRIRPPGKASHSRGLSAAGLPGLGPIARLSPAPEPRTDRSLCEQRFHYVTWPAAQATVVVVIDGQRHGRPPTGASADSHSQRVRRPNSLDAAAALLSRIKVSWSGPSCSCAENRWSPSTDRCSRFTCSSVRFRRQILRRRARPAGRIAKPRFVVLLPGCGRLGE